MRRDCHHKRKRMHAQGYGRERYWENILLFQNHVVITCKWKYPCCWWQRTWSTDIVCKWTDLEKIASSIPAAEYLSGSIFLKESAPGLSIVPSSPSSCTCCTSREDHYSEVQEPRNFHCSQSTATSINSKIFSWYTRRFSVIQNKWSNRRQKVKLTSLLNRHSGKPIVDVVVDPILSS